MTTAATYRTAVELVEALAESSGDITFPDGAPRLAHTDLPPLAQGAARLLRDEGVRPGSVVGVLTATEPSFFPALFGVLAAGAAVSVLPTPLLDPASAADRLAPIIDVAGMRELVVTAPFRPTAEALCALRPGLRVLDLSAPEPAAHPPARLVRPDDPAVVQFTSGSTARPKGVVLTHSQLLSGITAIVSQLRATPDDVFAQWVPLFHDLGLIGALTALATPAPSHLFGPLGFIRNPERLLEYLADRGVTICTGPNFGYERMIGAEPRIHPGGLGRWRLAINGGETVTPRTVRRFRETFEPSGVADAAMYPCYGMAEATLAITMPEPGEEPATASVHRRHLNPGRPVVRVADDHPDATEFVALGRPVLGMRVRIVHGDRVLPEGTLGEIEIRGDAVTSGYLNDDTATAAAFHDGWLRTGDLGFQLDGQLYVVGRIKEMIVVHGRNFYPADVENVARSVAGVHHGHAVAFADARHEQIVVVAECAEPSDDRLGADIEAAVSERLGLAAVRARLVGRNRLPRTTSGKWKRLEIQRLHTPESLERSRS
ncbi:AMP-binding protein [Nocardia mexicana]|uniref:Acyl-CoA synthetase (AMP-forming)/AMP-acid ligase II n=1 Tax=Nocardia mexicana TaxID=279262 RepID=A0A370H3G2_9NOCA|nr:AMP-binding protein [Nocardia mexicana]RDI50746.1 acyl-CoA synthetase (AMP-forming)/AMP-acid ligase II [Nocardia mexicana]